MNKIRVLHIITRLDPGGSSFNTIETVARLDPKRYESFLLFGKTEDADGRIEKSLKEKNIPYRCLPMLKREIDPACDLRAFVQLRRFILEGRFDVVHTHTSKAGILGRWAAKTAGVKRIIHTPHGHIFYGYFGPLKTGVFIWVERLTALITTRIITLTNRGKEDHVHFKIAPSSKFVQIYSGIDLPERPAFLSLQEKENFKERWDIPKDVFIFGTVGRLDPIKGSFFLIKALQQVVKQYPKAHLLLVGGGQQKEQLQKEVEVLGLKKHVTFAGFQNDIRPFMACMDVFMLASLNEGQGRVLLEAMAEEKPAIATSVGGIPEIITDGTNGFLVQARDHEAMALAMVKFLNYPQLAQRMGKQSKTMLGTKFTLDKMVRDIEWLYTSLIDSV